MDLESGKRLVGGFCEPDRKIDSVYKPLCDKLVEINHQFPEAVCGCGGKNRRNIMIEFKESLLSNPDEDLDFIQQRNDAARYYCLALVRMCDFMIVKLE